MSVRIHPTSVVSDQAKIGDGTQIWLFCQIRENVTIGADCMVGKGLYVDPDVTIGNNVKIGNNVSISCACGRKLVRQGASVRMQ